MVLRDVGRSSAENRNNGNCADSSLNKKRSSSENIDDVEYEVKELTEYAKENNITINFVKIDSLKKSKNAPCIFNNWANFYKGKFISNTILNANSFEKLIRK